MASNAISVAVSSVFTVNIVNAQSATGDNSQLEEVLVTGRIQEASEIAVDLEKFGNSVQVITSQVIADAGYTNFAEIAQGLIRGANVGYSPDEGEYTIRLDGGGDRDTLVTLDGVPLFDRGPGVETIWGATLIPSRMIDRVEVFRGGQSLYFGSNGGLGVVNVITKKPDGSFKGDIGAMYGANNTREIWGNVSFPLTEDGRHSIMLYGDRYASDGHRIFTQEAETDGIRQAGGIDDYSSSRDNLGVKYLWKIDETSEFNANLQYTQINFQDTFPGSTVYGPTASKMPLINLSYAKEWSEYWKTDVQLSYRAPELTHLKLIPEMCRRAEGCQSPSAAGETIAQGQWLGSLVSRANRGVGENSIMGGFEELVATMINKFRINDSIEAVVGFQSTNYRDTSEEIVNIDDDIFSVNAIFIDARFTPSFSPSTTFSFAGRSDFADAFGREDIWKFGFRQPVGGGVYIRANGGTSFSLPRTNELFATSENFVGNPDLQTERTTTFNGGIGIDRSFGVGRFSGEVGGFRTDIKDRIRATRDLIPNTRFNDPALTEIRGLTADGELEFGDNWSLALSYTRQDASPEGSDRQINSIPKWFVTGNLRWRSDSNRYHVNILPRYQGPELVEGPLGLPDLDFGSYFLLNGSVGYWAGEGFRHRLQLRFVNILDETYGERGGFGDQRFGEAFLTGQISTSDQEYRYPYIFQGKPRSVFLTYTYQL